MEGALNSIKKMATEKLHLPQESNMKEILKTIILREVEDILHLNFNILGNFKMERSMVTENVISKTAHSTKEIIRMDQKKVMDNIPIKREKYTKGYGKKANLLQCHLLLGKNRQYHNRVDYD